MLIVATLPAEPRITITGITSTPAGGAAITPVSARPAAAYPRCGTAARRMHSRYVRPRADLLWQGLAVALLLTTRRYFCAATAYPPACAPSGFRGWRRRQAGAAPGSPRRSRQSGSR